MNGAVVRRTQELLGRVIRKPPLTDRLLSKPPFRYLHDVIGEVRRGGPGLRVTRLLGAAGRRPPWAWLGAAPEGAPPRRVRAAPQPVSPTRRLSPCAAPREPRRAGGRRCPLPGTVLQAPVSRVWLQAAEAKEGGVWLEPSPWGQRRPGESPATEGLGQGLRRAGGLGLVPILPLACRVAMGQSPGPGLDT